MPSGEPVECHFVTSYSPSHCHEAVLQYGDNGSGNNAELIVNGSEGQWTWDPQQRINFDSGVVSVEFSLQANGNANLIAAKSTSVGSVSNSGWAHGLISRVQIGAAVVANPRRQMRWSNIVVKYYRGGGSIPIEVQTRPVECQPVADTYNLNRPAFQAVEYTPMATNIDAVTVTGQLRLLGDRGTIDFEFAPSDFYAKILIFGSNCVPR